MSQARVRIVESGGELYIYSKNNPEILKQSAKYAKIGINVLENYSGRVFRIHGTDNLVVERLTGTIVPVGTIAEYNQKKEKYEAYVLSILAV